jgi:hypothetical protein
MKATLDRILFIHVPKTGGTTFDNLIAGNFDPTKAMRNLTAFSGKNLLAAKHDINLSYVGGHVPSAIFDLDQFSHKITVLRDPRAVIASLGSFSHRHSYHNPRLKKALASGQHYDIYASYFCDRFDLNRMLLDYEYGIFSDVADYVSLPDDVGRAVARLKQFNWVIDFSDLDALAKTLIVELCLFPFRKIDRKRHSEYQADLSFAEDLVSEFDRDFYTRSRELFTKARVTQVEYDLYRQNYASQFGVDLLPWSDIQYDLRMPVGQMWHLPEISELGRWYRWSERFGVTIEIPVKHSGVYEISIYARNSPEAKLINIMPTFADGVELLSQDVSAYDSLTVSRNLVKLTSYGWTDFAVDIEILDGMEQSHDDRDIGIALGDIFIRRVSD